MDEFEDFGEGFAEPLEDDYRDFEDNCAFEDERDDLAAEMRDDEDLDSD